MPGSPAPALRWWAQRWLGVVEAQSPEFSGRLRRAKSYSRSGHVWRLSVQPGKLSAQVLGSYGYYSSTVHLPVVQSGLWERAIEPLAERPALLAALLADDLPADFESLLYSAGIPLFPSHAGEFMYHCTCPDWERPCKHTLAVCFEFAMRCDAQPSLLVELAGRTLDQLMAAVRARRRTDSDDPTPGSEVALHPLRAEGYYAAGSALDSFRITYDPPQVSASLLLHLGKPPFSGDNEDPIPRLAAFYDVMSDMALRTLLRARQITSSGTDARAEDPRATDLDAGRAGDP